MRHPALACFAALLAAVLGACVSHPRGNLDQLRPQEFTSTASPRDLVRCVALNARSFSEAYTADWSERVRPDSFEAVVIRSYSPIYYYPPIILAQTEPAPGGSRLLLYVSSEFGPAESADWAARLRRGCDVEVGAARVPPLVPREGLPAENPPASTPVPASPPPAGRTRG
jgi:hypothetical protein